MLTTLFLLATFPSPAQNPGPLDWPGGPRLNRAQELVYRGTYAEESAGAGVQFNRGYRLENLVFVLDTPARSAEVAIMTVLRSPNARPEAPPASLRLEVGRLDLQGRLSADPGTALAPPLDGPPTLECGVFVEVPGHLPGPDRSWVTAEEGRPARAWRVVGSEILSGTRCVKVEGLQQTDDWDRPRGDRTAWRRRDLVWLAPRQGIAYRVERTIERREPGHTEPTGRSTTKYELVSTLQYPGQLYEDRRRDILQARAFAESAAPLLAGPGRYPSQLEALHTKLSYHLDHYPPTPYREALVQVRARVEAARRGETLPVLPAGYTDDAPTVVAAVGRPAPDFVVTDFTGDRLARFKTWLDRARPVLLVFYSPTSPTVRDLLTFAQEVNEEFGSHGVTVLGLAVAGDGQAIRGQRTELGVTFPVLSGAGLRQSYAVEATPKLMVIDGGGVVRGSWIGWGKETPGAVTEELRRWLKAAKAAGEARGTDP